MQAPTLSQNLTIISRGGGVTGTSVVDNNSPEELKSKTTQVQGSFDSFIMASQEPPPEMTTTPENPQGEQAGSNNPLFRLVNAATSILEPNNPKKNEAAMDKGLTEESASAATAPKDKESAAAAANATAAASGDSKTAAQDPNPVPNVLRGTKEDLMLDPKIKISFGEHLYNVLENEEHHDVLNWMPDGKSFTVVNHKKFVLQKMPTLFQIRNMSSFVRKLGRWGFSRVFEKETNNSDVFKHPHFVRGDRAGVRKHVKCLGRSAAPKQPQGSGTTGPRQPDFVVRQEPGKPPMVLSKGGAPIPAPLMSQLQFHPPLDPLRSRALGYGPYAAPPSSLDQVANASAASAQALYLSHQQQQKVKMEQLAAADQQHLEDMEIERLMKRRQMRQQQKMQQQYFLEQQRRLMLEKNAGSAPETGKPNSSSAQQIMDNSLSGSSRGSVVLPAPQQTVPPDAMARLNNMDLRRVSMQHGGSLDGSLGRSISSRFSAHSEAAAAHQVTPVYDSRSVLSAAYETLQRDEMRSRERQAAIRALLAEEQEYEALRRAAYGGPSGSSSYPRGN